jgi:ssDNA-binding Zn-finger/Zn-ribbon topoisomerase 1
MELSAEKHPVPGRVAKGGQRSNESNHLIGSGKTMSKAKKTCPQCDEVELTRVARRGFMQERVYPKFGMFPWECAQCRQIFLLKSRGRSYRKAGPNRSSAD